MDGNELEEFLKKYTNFNTLAIEYNQFTLDWHCCINAEKSKNNILFVEKLKFQEKDDEILKEKESNDQNIYCELYQIKMKMDSIN